MEKELNVYKFGGTSQKNLDALVHSIDLLRNDKYARAVVVSAPAGVTNLLQIAADNMLKEGSCSKNIIEEIIYKYEEVTNSFKNKKEIMRGIRLSLYERLFANAITNSKKSIDEEEIFVANMLSFGEEIQSVIFTNFLNYNGITANLLDQRAIIMEGDFLDGTYLRESDKNIQKNLIKNNILVVPGFIGYNSKGQRMVFDRGGSDFTQALVARAINATACYNCTDVNGIMQINPRLIPQEEQKHIKTIEELHYSQAQELSSQGAKVLHPRCLEPLIEQEIPMYVLNTFNPNGPRTKIYNKLVGEPKLIAVAGKKDSFTNISLHTGAMEGKSGYVLAFAEALKNVNLETITTSAVEITASFSGKSKHIDSAIKSLGDYGVVKVNNGTALISLVGERIGEQPEYLAQIFDVFSKNKIFVNGQISKANNYSIGIAINSSDFERAQVVIYNSLLKSK